MRRRGRVGGGVEVVAERCAERDLVALVGADLLQHRRPEVASCAVEQLPQGPDLRIEPLARPFGLGQSGAGLCFCVAGCGGARIRCGGRALGGGEGFGGQLEPAAKRREIGRAGGLVDGLQLPVGLRQLRIRLGQAIRRLPRGPLGRLPPRGQLGQRALRVSQCLLRPSEIGLDMGEMLRRRRPSGRVGGDPLLQRGCFGGERGQRTLGVLDRLAPALAIALEFGQPVRQFAEARLGPTLLLIHLFARDLQALQGRRPARLVLPQGLDAMLGYRKDARRLALQPRPFGDDACLGLELSLGGDELGAGVQHREMHQQGLGATDMGGDILVAHRLPRLLAQRIDLRFQMAQHVLDAGEIILGGLQPELGLMPA